LARPAPATRLPNTYDEEAESGRGLLLVETLSEKFDWYPHEEFGGKVVWSLIGAET
jgi:anti-sigma regulatory factor (Ser/Thr protein kinase)